MATSPPFFRECLNPSCGLRYPVAHAGEDRPDCPRCATSAPVVTRALLPTPEANPDSLPRIHRHRRHVLLDNLRSTYNVGSIFRTADGAGWDRLYLGGITPTPAHPRVGKTALGAENSLAWEYHANSVALAARLKAAGNLLWILECSPAAIPLHAPELVRGLNRDLVLVMGNEVVGVDPGILELCDQVVAIPMAGQKGSLNVAVAFGVAAYWFTLARSGPGSPPDSQG